MKKPSPIVWLNQRTRAWTGPTHKHLCKKQVVPPKKRAGFPPFGMNGYQVYATCCTWIARTRYFLMRNGLGSSIRLEPGWPDPLQRKPNKLRSIAKYMDQVESNSIGSRLTRLWRRPIFWSRLVHANINGYVVELQFWPIWKAKNYFLHCEAIRSRFLIAIVPTDLWYKPKRSTRWCRNWSWCIKFSVPNDEISHAKKFGWRKFTSDFDHNQW